MELKQCVILGFFCVVILVPISLSEQFELSSSPSVNGTVGHDVILPCQISLGRPPQDIEVLWQKIGDNNVIIYQFQAPSGLETFGQGYKSRIVLAKEGLPKGNMSLQLKNVQVTDEGTYRCIVKSAGWSSNTGTVLHVAGMGMVSIGILGPEGEGIKLTCRSSGWFPRPELQWLLKDNQSHPFELKQDHGDQSFSVFSSITVLRVTTEVTCLVHVRSPLQMEQKSTIFLSRDIFPQTSPWLPAFWVLFMLSFLVFGVTGYYIYKEKQKYSQKKCSEEEEKCIQGTEKTTLESDNLDLHRRLERARTELDFRKAQSYLVHVHLDPSCKHPDLTVSADCNEVQHNLTSSGTSAMSGALIVVGKEGFGKGKQYWQVTVWDKSDWELGVLKETTKGVLKKQVSDTPQKEGYWSLRKSNGKYHPEEANHEISELTVKPKMIGVYLDCEDHTLSFYSINGMAAIVKIPINTSEKLYPFFSPGRSKVGDEVKPLSICHNRDWDFPIQLSQCPESATATLDLDLAQHHHSQEPSQAGAQSQASHGLPSPMLDSLPNSERRQDAKRGTKPERKQEDEVEQESSVSEPPPNQQPNKQLMPTVARQQMPAPWQKLQKKLRKQAKAEQPEQTPWKGRTRSSQQRGCPPGEGWEGQGEVGELVGQGIGEEGRDMGDRQNEGWTQMSGIGIIGEERGTEAIGSLR